MKILKLIFSALIFSTAFFMLTACSTDTGYNSMDPLQSNVGKQLETAPPPPGAAR